jgi:NAD(P)-dependent dehydrogenase (short-subunit alcohol dehydrogenase family)
MTDNPYTNQFRLDGKRAVLIGAGGIGREIALALAAHGASVICADKDVETAKATAAEIDGEAIALDVTDPHAVDQAARDAGEVDVLVLTAAMNVRKRILDYSLEEFDRVVGLNLRATFSVVQAFGRTMVERGRGSIVVFSSIRGYMVEPGQSVYAATKAGAIQLVKTAAVEFGEAGVRVNAVAPGVVETPLTAQIKADEDWYRAYATKGALGRWSQPSELTGAVVYLASDAASFVTGSTLIVDGGWTAVDGRFTPPA